MEDLKRIVWIAAGIIAGAALISKTKKIINHADTKRAEEKHQMILGLLIESDERAKKLLELEEVKKLKIKFIKHFKSRKFYDTSKKLFWKWSTHLNRKISIPLDRKNSIIPYDKDKRLCVLAHEIGHLLLGEFSFLNFQHCANQIKSCLSTELRAHVIGAELLQKINVQFEKSFWRNKLINKWDQCKECLKIISQRRCPKSKREKIKKALYKIARSVKD